MNNHIVYYNYYAKIPFFVLFIAFGIAGVVTLMAMMEIVKLYRCSFCDYWALLHFPLVTEFDPTSGASEKSKERLVYRKKE